MGFAVGCGFAVAQLVSWGIAESVLRGRSLQVFSAAFDVLNTPANWLGSIWINSGLPPRGEAAWPVAGIVGMLIQWGAIGLVGGFFYGLRCGASK